MRLPFLRSKSAAPAAERARPASDDAAVAAERTRARRRLLGALVLLVAGVVGFPWLFETQPRPLPLDTPIATSRRDALREAPAAGPTRPGARQMLPSSGAVDARSEVVVAAAPPVEAPLAAAAASAAPTSAPPQSPPAPRGRFVVQVGAYSDATALRDARAKVEKLGLKTYTQIIANDAGQRTRVRLGPFASREDADAAAAKVRRAGLPANIVTL